MSVVKINSYVNVTNITEEDALNNALVLVNAFDNVNESRFSEGVITKLYYITPVLGKILVVVNDSDKETLGLDSNILSNVNISDYPLVKLPSQLIDYKELIIKFGSTLSAENILNAAQTIANDAATKSLPYKISVVKVINYNNSDPSQLVMSSVFGGNIFSNIGDVSTQIVNAGDAEAGQEVLDSPQGVIDLSIEVKTQASDKYEDNLFGYYVDVSNSKMVIGAHGEDNYTGAAYIYDLDGTNEIKMQSSDLEVGDFFGQSVAISDSKIVVGAYGEDTGASGAGAVYVYDLDGTNEIKIQASDKQENDWFGYHVAVSDSKIVVGARYEDTGGSNAGAVYIYDLDGTNEIKIQASDKQENDWFGYRVAVGSKIVVGAHSRDNNTGAAYIYDLDGTNEIKIQASDKESETYFGVFVELNTSKIIIGSIRSNDNTGAVYIYDLEGTNEIKIVASDKEENDLFGFMGAISDSKIVIGAPYEDTGGVQAGAAYIYG